MFKRLYYISFAGYLLFFLLSILFYRERTAFTDIAYHIFVLVKDRTFLPNVRFGAAGTQVFPLMAIKAGLGLNAIMQVYSIGFVLYHFLYFLVCGFVCKKYEFGLVIVLFNVLFVSHTFYWVQSEFPQGINLFICLLAVASTIKPGQLKLLPIAIFFAGMVVVAFFHPLIVFPVGYAIVFFLLSPKEHTIDRRLLGVMILFFGAVYVVKVVFFQVSYDAQSIDKSFKELELNNFFGIHANKHFLQNCKQKYYWIPLLSLGITAHYFFKRRWLKLVFFCISVPLYVIMINVTHPKGDVLDFYMENLYLPVGLFLALPFVFDVLPAIVEKDLKMKFAPEVLFGLILFTGCYRIYATHGIYTKRLNWELDFLKENEGKKLVVDDKKVPLDILLMTWGTPFEFWLLSTSQNHKTATILINENADNYKGSLYLKKHFVTIWANYPYAELPAKYFIFTDTTSEYMLVK